MATNRSQGIPPRTLPASPEQWRPVYEILRNLTQQSRATQLGFDAIVRGESPDGSGLALIDLTQYLYLPGRMGGQTVQGIDSAYPAVTFNTSASGLTTPGSLGYPYIRFSHENTMKLDIVPLLNNGAIVDVAFKLYASGFLFVDSDITTAGIRFAFSSTNTFIQCGRVQADGSVANKNMQLGGMNATCGSRFNSNFNTNSFSSSGTDADTYSRVGINIDPYLLTGISDGDRASLTIKSYPGTDANLIRYSMAFRILTGTAVFAGTDSSVYRTPIFSVKNGTGVAGDNEVFQIDRIGRLMLCNPANGSIVSRISGRNYPFAVEQDLTASTTRLNFGVGFGANAFSDNKFTQPFFMCDTTATHKGAILGAKIATTWQPMDRFAIMSLATMIGNGAAAEYPSTNWTVPAGLLHLKNMGAVGTVVLVVQRVSGQTGDLTQWLDTDGATKLAAVDKDGNFSMQGLNALVDTDTGDIITHEGEIVFSI